MKTPVTIIGAGLSGSEAALTLAHQGIPVHLYEMRPVKQTGAHATSNCAELVCSNSLGSHITHKASGLLKAETKMLGSQLLPLAEETAVPAGHALAVDREAFSALVTQKIKQEPLITYITEEITRIPDGPVIIASGPLTSPALSSRIAELAGETHLYFFDALAPIVTRDSIDMTIAFKASRYDEEAPGDYINCPLNKEEYENFVAELLKGERIPLKEFEEAIEGGVKAGLHHFFEGCLPVEVIAMRGPRTLAFGPMRPVGITNPKTGKWPYAVVQLRQDNVAGSLYNLVGFQTNLKFEEQERVLRLIPGLQNAEFVRFGQMHRNTFINSPQLLQPTLQWKTRDNLFFAGQITGVEGYMGNVATGLVAGLNMARFLKNEPMLNLPQTTMLGALLHYITHAEAKHFQPMKANFGILPPLEGKTFKKERGKLYAERALKEMELMA
ncbi:methylenetetrahydrofolate--tRNA-(uracil(54)-C(5))-methyltransferase (FADH(2)-oxidizing) TrmFO [bacterium]|nr:methylenetetrahydrofolate--tRNA-(uracil(54)-C(5))-methyltransferase (FADH(2)-oxidizing) TrmFO [bacterium]